MVMLIRNADLGGKIKDVRLIGSLISEIGDGLSLDESVFDAGGKALIPGLHDHHIHLNATAASMASVRCGPPNVKSAEELISVLNAQGEGWLRGVGYHHSVAGEIDRIWLDEFGPMRPVRIQHRSGRVWILNSLAMAELSLSWPSNGRLLDHDNAVRSGSEFPDLQPLVNRLLSYGITGVTEVTPSNGTEEYHRYQNAAKPLRLSIMGRASLNAQQSKHLKLHYHDNDLPSLDSLAQEIGSAHKSGRNIAVHCVTRAELMLTLAAIEMVGPRAGDRIEHAAIADKAAIDWMKQLGVIVVTQPNFIVERQTSYLVDVPEEDHENLWRLKAFADAGLSLAAGSDAPFGDPNPWAAMAAAVTRPKGFEAESISPELALALYTKPSGDAGAASRKVEIGAVADLCLLDRPWVQARDRLAEVRPVATWISGELVYNRID